MENFREGGWLRGPFPTNRERRFGWILQQVALAGFALQLDAAAIPAKDSGMKRISVWAIVVSFLICVARAPAQDSAVQQQLDQITGKLQDLTNAQVDQDKRLTALEKQVADLADKVNTPVVNNSASADDLKKLAEQLQEVDQKRQDDRELILKEIEKLGKISAEAASTPIHHSPSSNAGSGDAAAPVAVDGYDYIVKKDDTLSTIAKAYREQHIHVTVAQILKANPGLDATKLYVNRKIIIPKPAAN